MNEEIKKILYQLIYRYPVLKKTENSIIEAYLILKQSFQKEGKLLIACLLYTSRCV